MNTLKAILVGRIIVGLIVAGMFALGTVGAVSADAEDTLAAASGTQGEVALNAIIESPDNQSAAALSLVASQVARTAIENAPSVAAMVLTTE